MEKNRFSFNVDQECVEFYDGENLMCIMTDSQMLQFQQTLKQAMSEWSKVNKSKLDNPRCKL